MDDGKDAIVEVNGGPASIADVVRVARGGAAVRLGAGARERLAASRTALAQALAAGEIIYGVNTGPASRTRC